MANYLCHSPVERLYILPNLHVGRSNGSIDSDRVSPLGENHGGIASHHHQSDVFLIANSEYGKQHAVPPAMVGAATPRRPIPGSADNSTVGPVPQYHPTR